MVIKFEVIEKGETIVIAKSSPEQIPRPYLAKKITHDAIKPINRMIVIIECGARWFGCVELPDSLTIVLGFGAPLAFARTSRDHWMIPLLKVMHQSCKGSEKETARDRISLQ